MKKTLLVAAVLLALVVFGGLAILYVLPFDPRDRSPEQPIAFSHRIHAGDNEIDCLFCHRFARQSAVAGIPDMDTCRVCHQYIAQDAPEVKKLMTYWQRKEPVAWVRLHKLPDHVYFSHEMHLRAGLDCKRCHGEVASMERTRRIASLKMGWCLGCHRQHEASIDCWICHI
jgi:hypothetical protein